MLGQELRIDPMRIDSDGQGGSFAVRRSLIALFCACLGFWLPIGPGTHLAQASPGQILAVQGGDAVLRTAPRSDAEAVVTLTPDHRLIEFERRDGWVRVGVDPKPSVRVSSVRRIARGCAENRRASTGRRPTGRRFVSGRS